MVNDFSKQFSLDEDEIEDFKDNLNDMIEFLIDDRKLMLTRKDIDDLCEGYKNYLVTDFVYDLLLVKIQNL